MTDLFQSNLLSQEDVDSALFPEEKVVEEQKKEAAAPVVEVKQKTKEIEEPKKVEDSTPVLLEIEDDEDGEENTQTPTKPVKAGKKVEEALNYKALVEHYIEEGDWVKPDNWDEVKDEVEWDGKLFADFQKQQFDAKVKAAVESEKEQFSPDYKQLLEHVQSGGQLKDLLPSYQQQMEVADLNSADENDAEQILKTYYESVNWGTKAEIQEEIDSLKDRGNDKFKAIAEKRKADLVSAFEEERDEIIAQQKYNEEQKRFQREAVVKKVREQIQSFNEPDREKKEIEEFWLKPKYQSGDRKFSEFEKVSNEIYNDPTKFAKFVKLIKNFDKVTESAKTEKQVKKDTFQFLLSGQKELGKNNNLTPESEKKSKQKGLYNPFQISSGV